MFARFATNLHSMMSAGSNGASAILRAADMTDPTPEKKLVDVAKNELMLIANVTLKLAVALLIFEGLAWIGTVVHKWEQPPVLAAGVATPQSFPSPQAETPAVSETGERMQSSHIQSARAEHGPQ